MRRDRRPGQLDRRGVPLRVVRMPVGVDDMGDGQPLVGGALDEHARRVRRVDQDPLPRLTIADQIPEVAVAAGPNLFED